MQKMMTKDELMELEPGVHEVKVRLTYLTAPEPRTEYDGEATLHVELLASARGKGPRRMFYVPDHAWPAFFSDYDLDSIGQLVSEAYMCEVYAPDPPPSPTDIERIVIELKERIENRRRGYSDGAADDDADYERQIAQEEELKEFLEWIEKEIVAASRAA